MHIRRLGLDRPKAIYRLLLLGALAQVFFMVLPEADLWMSSWFFDPVDRFWLTDTWAAVAVRESILMLMYLLVLAVLCALVLAKIPLRWMQLPIFSKVLACNPPAPPSPSAIKADAKGL